MTPEQFAARKAYIREYAMREVGRDDDQTCFDLAILFCSALMQDGMNRAEPDRQVKLELDSGEPVT